MTEDTDSCMKQLGHHKTGHSKLTGLCCSRAAAKDVLELHFSSRLVPVHFSFTLDSSPLAVDFTHTGLEFLRS